MATCRARRPHRERPEYQPGFEDADTSCRRRCRSTASTTSPTATGCRPPALLRSLPRARGHAGVTPERRARRVEQASPLDRIAPRRAAVAGRPRRQDSLVAGAEDARRSSRRSRGDLAARWCYAEMHGAQHAFEVFPSVRRRVVPRRRRPRGAVAPPPAVGGGGRPASRAPPPVPAPAATTSIRRPRASAHHHVGWGGARNSQGDVWSVTASGSSRRAPSDPRGTWSILGRRTRAEPSCNERRTPMTETAMGAAVDLTEATDAARALVLAHTGTRRSVRWPTTSRSGCSCWTGTATSSTPTSSCTSSSASRAPVNWARWPESVHPDDRDRVLAVASRVHANADACRRLPGHRRRGERPLRALPPRGHRRRPRRGHRPHRHRRRPHRRRAPARAPGHPRRAHRACPTDYTWSSTAWPTP